MVELSGYMHLTTSSFQVLEKKEKLHLVYSTFLLSACNRTRYCAFARHEKSCTDESYRFCFGYSLDENTT